MHSDFHVCRNTAGHHAFAKRAHMQSHVCMLPAKYSALEGYKLLRIANANVMSHFLARSISRHPLPQGLCHHPFCFSNFLPRGSFGAALLFFSLKTAFPFFCNVSLKFRLIFSAKNLFGGDIIGDIDPFLGC